jgi:disulfide bond formation protein DsbB
VRCDEAPWSLFGLSMAGWNALASLGLAALGVLAAQGGLRGRGLEAVHA